MTADQKTRTQFVTDVLKECFTTPPGNKPMTAVTLEFVELDQVSPTVKAVFRLVLWYWDEDKKAFNSIRDVKEETVVMCSSRLVETDRARFRDAVVGLILAIDQVASKDNAELETLMPRDFMFPKVFDLKTPKWRHQYRDHFLTDGRLGKYLPTRVFTT